MSALRGVTVSVLVAATIAGCLRSLPFNHYVLRAPQLTIGDLGEVRVGGRCAARIEDVEVRVSALSAGDSLLIILNFDAHAWGYSFDPMQTALAVRAGGRISPRAYVGPGKLNWVRGKYRECVAFDNQSPPLTLRSDPAWHALPPRDTCFVLTFPMQPVQPYADLELAGLAVGQRRLAVTGFQIGGILWSNVIDVQPKALE